MQGGELGKAQTIAEKILSRKAGRDVRAGDVVMCTADRIIGTDASSPMAIDYFEKMGGVRLFELIASNARDGIITRLLVGENPQFRASACAGSRGGLGEKPR